MRVVATYNLKGGVGKTAAAVNLAYLAARDGLRTLLWDLDAQGAAGFYLRVRPGSRGAAAELLARRKHFTRAIRATDYPRLDMIPADISMRNLDLELKDFKKSTRRLSKLVRELESDYDLVLLDCAPTMSVTSENVFRVADILLVPLIPTHLSLRAYEQVHDFASQNDANSAVIVPFFSMVDRRKRLHRDLIIEFSRAHPEVLRSFVPYASQVERMGEQRAPVNQFADASPGGRAYRALWAALCERVGLELPASDT